MSSPLLAKRPLALIKEQQHFYNLRSLKDSEVNKKPMKRTSTPAIANIVHSCFYSGLSPGFVSNC
jgi:hypothetical protein